MAQGVDRLALQPGDGGLGYVQRPGGFAIPPMCETVEDCATAGLPDANCSELMNIPVKFCVQSCTVDEPPAGDAGVTETDAG